MTDQELIVGVRVDHPRYGIGYVSAVSLVSCDIIFERGGKISFPKRSVLDDLQLMDASEGDNKPKLSLAEVEEVLTSILEKYNATNENVELGERWINGTLTLTPGNGAQPKEMPIETFFHKIVMVRDRLRVLEQNINSHKKLSDEDKVDLQQYITRSYGSLTSFNLLFKDKEDYFVGTGGKGE